MGVSTPLKAIRAKCLDCTCGQVKEVTLCPIPECSLYAYRFGRGSTRQLTDEQKQALITKLRKSTVSENPPIN